MLLLPSNMNNAYLEQRPQSIAFSILQHLRPIMDISMGGQPLQSSEILERIHALQQRIGPIDVDPYLQMHGFPSEATLRVRSLP
jgi:hypothetical protein